MDEKAVEIVMTMPEPLDLSRVGPPRRVHTVAARLHAHELATLDALRDGRPRSEVIVEALKAWCARQT